MSGRGENSEASFSGIALDALEAARSAQAKGDQNERDIAGHEKVCAERYANINEKIGTLFKLMAWGGSTALMLVLALLGFLAKTQFDAINSRDEASRQIAEILRRQPPAPQVVVQPATGAPSPGVNVERQQP